VSKASTSNDWIEMQSTASYITAPLGTVENRGKNSTIHGKLLWKWQKLRH